MFVLSPPKKWTAWKKMSFKWIASFALSFGRRIRSMSMSIRLVVFVRTPRPTQEYYGRIWLSGERKLMKWAILQIMFYHICYSADMLSVKTSQRTQIEQGLHFLKKKNLDKPFNFPKNMSNYYMTWQHFTCKIRWKYIPFTHKDKIRWRYNPFTHKDMIRRK